MEEGKEISRQTSDDWVVLAAVSALWAQLFLSAIPVWRFGEYYEYGWYVPPLAGFFLLRRWHNRPGDGARELPLRWPFGVAILLFPVLLVIRSVAGFDPSWRPPILFHALLVVILSHWFLFLRGGKRLSLTMAPVTVFALSAIPYPWQFEKGLIAQLTDWVVQLSASLFNLSGRPVEILGTKLSSMGTEVEVTDGCSGIRSLQSLMMAGLFFGEMFLLRTGQRLVLLAFTACLVIVVNIGRVMTLSHIRFDRGEQAFEAAHDQVGHITFLVSAACLLVAARTLVSSQDGRRKLVRRTQKHAP